MQTIGNCVYADYVVVSGSLPPGTSVNVFHEIAIIAKQLNAKDVNSKINIVNFDFINILH